MWRPGILPPERGSVEALRAQAGTIVTPGTESSPDAGQGVRLNFSRHPERAVAAVGRLTQFAGRYAT